jgi:hypothetical protein
LSGKQKKSTPQAQLLKAEKKKRQRQKESRLQKRLLANKDHNPKPSYDDNERTLVTTQSTPFCFALDADPFCSSGL